MLEKAVVALKADQAKALQMFTKGEGGFREKDLYPYCAAGRTATLPRIRRWSVKA